MSAYYTALEHIIGLLTDSEDLDAIVDGRIWEGTVPPKATYPLILIQQYGDAVDYIGNGPQRAATTVEVTVRVIDAATDIAGVKPAADLIDSVLNATGPVATASGHVAACVRVAELSMTENSDGKTWRYLGGRYRLVTS